MPKNDAPKRPKTKKRNEALAQLKDALGANYSYRKLAAVVRLPANSFSLLQKIVNGDVCLQPDLALQLMAYTGADSKSLLEGRRALDLNGRPYTRQSFDSWENAKPSADVAEATADRAAELVRGIVLGAYSSCSTRRFNEVTLLLSRAIEGLVGQFSLARHINNALKTRVRSGKWQEMTLGQLKEVLRMSHAGESPWDEGAARQHADETNVEVRHAYRALYTPLTGRGRTTAGDSFFAQLVALNEELIEVRFPWAPEKTMLFAGTRVITAGVAGASSAMFAQPKLVQTRKGKRDTRRHARRSTTKKKGRK